MGFACRHVTIALGLAPLLLAQSAVAQDGFLSPLGPVAEFQRDHLVRVTLITMIALVPVLLGVPLILWRYHHQKKSQYEPGALYRPDWEFSVPLEVIMWGVPVAIVAVLAWWLWHETDRLDPYEAMGPNPLEVQAIGLDWKWLFLYPEQGFATLGEMAVPVDRPVRVALTTDTVMQSFRVSALAGQIYAMPGMRTELNFAASRPGTARGENMQFSGTGFAQQSFTLRALSAEDWTNWTRQQPDLTLDAALYARLARSATLAVTLHRLGLQDGAARFDLALPDLFDSVMARYGQNAPLPATEQPGSPAYGRDDD